MENDDDFLNEQDEDTVRFCSFYQTGSAQRLSLDAGRVQCRALADISRLYYGFKIDPSRCHIFYACKLHVQTSGLDISSIWSEIINVFQLKELISTTQQERAQKIIIPQEST